MENGCTYVGLDLYAHPEWNKRTEKHGSSVRFVHTPFLAWETNERFSAILDNGCFHHQHPDEYRPYLQKVHELLLPGGLFMLGLYTVNDDDKEGELKVMPSGKYKREFSPSSIQRLLQENGFRYLESKKVEVAERGRMYLQVLAQKAPHKGGI